MSLESIRKALENLNANHDWLVARAEYVLDGFWDEARNSGRVMYHGVTISKKGKYIDIYWMRLSYRKHEDGPQDKPFKIRLSKGRGFRFSRKSMGKMDVFTESLFNRCEDEFEVLRELLSKNKKVYRDLVAIKSRIECKLYDECVL